jgi:hypothetical protein
LREEAARKTLASSTPTTERPRSVLSLRPALALFNAVVVTQRRAARGNAYFLFE